MKGENLLRSWKEIAAYLGCDRRTCFRWEKKLSLPVHRIEGSAKGSVFAYKEELDQWILERSKANGAHPGKAPEIHAARRKRWLSTRTALILFHLAVVVGLGLGFFFIGRKSYPTRPHNFKIDGSVLTILDGKGRELWTFDTGLKNLVEDAAYRTHFQVKRRDALDRPLFPQLLIEDINVDGRAEVLFSTQTADEFHEGDLFCFNDHGRELWRFKAGRELKFGNKVYSPDFRITSVSAENLVGDRELEVLVICFHRPDWLCQAVLLSSHGEVLGEYWNSGQLNDYAFADLNQDGREEILLSGLNNEYGRGCLAVFDPRSFQGSSPQTSSQFRCIDLKAGTEKFYMLIPRTDADRGLNSVDAVEALDVLANRQISVRASLSGLYYLFNFALELQYVNPSHKFEQLYREALRAGRVKSTLNQDYLDRLGRDVLYWDGTRWTDHPSMSNKW